MKIAALMNKITRQKGVIHQLLAPYSRHHKTKKGKPFRFPLLKKCRD